MVSFENNEVMELIFFFSDIDSGYLYTILRHEEDFPVLAKNDFWIGLKSGIPNYFTTKHY